MHRTLKMTPAMAANMSDHIWTVEELIGAALETEADLRRSA